MESRIYLEINCKLFFFLFFQRRSESNFEEYVPATQDPRGSMTPKSKVKAWLVNDQLPESPLRKRRRQSSVKSLSKFLLDRSNTSTNADNNSSSEDFEAELDKIAQDKQKVNTKSNDNNSTTEDFEVELEKIAQNKQKVNAKTVDNNSSTEDFEAELAKIAQKQQKVQLMLLLQGIYLPYPRQ